MTRRFSDLLHEGEPISGWLELVGEGFTALSENPSEVVADLSAGPEPSRSAEVYVGTYGNVYFGPLAVWEQGGRLMITLGPDDGEFAPTPVGGDVFTYEPVGESGVGPAGVTVR